MAKAYWVATYKSISNPDALTAYAKLAGPADPGAGRQVPGARRCCEMLRRSGPIAAQRPSSSSTASPLAEAAHDSPGYQEALRALGSGADRDMRIIEGV